MHVERLRHPSDFIAAWRGLARERDTGTLRFKLASLTCVMPAWTANSLDRVTLCAAGDCWALLALWSPRLLFVCIIMDQATRVVILVTGIMPTRLDKCAGFRAFSGNATSSGSRAVSSSTTTTRHPTTTYRNTRA